MASQNHAFRIETSLYGDYQQYTIHDTFNGNRFSILPRFGACLTELVLCKGTTPVSIVESFKDVDEMREDLRCKSLFLIPFPNRLKDGQYEFEGKRYQFPIHEPSLKTSLHGFRYPLEMDIRVVDLTTERATITLGHCYEANHGFYPFHFDFEVRFMLDRSGNFEVGMKIENIGLENMPIGLGWHPYFSFGHEMDQVALQLPKSSSLEIDDQMIPTGKKSPVQYFLESKTISNRSIDNCFLYEGDAEKIELKLLGQNYGLSYWQDADPFQYFQLYVPPERESIAIEPMTCAPNALQSKEGLRTMKVNESLFGSCGVRILS